PHQLSSGAERLGGGVHVPERAGIGDDRAHKAVRDLFVDLGSQLAEQAVYQLTRCRRLRIDHADLPEIPFGGVMIDVQRYASRFDSGPRPADAVERSRIADDSQVESTLGGLAQDRILSGHPAIYLGDAVV